MPKDRCSNCGEYIEQYSDGKWYHVPFAMVTCNTARPPRVRNRMKEVRSFQYINATEGYSLDNAAMEALSAGVSYFVHNGELHYVSLTIEPKGPMPKVFFTERPTSGGQANS